MGGKGKRAGEGGQGRLGPHRAGVQKPRAPAAEAGEAQGGPPPRRGPAPTAGAPGPGEDDLPHDYDPLRSCLLVGEGNFSFARALVRLFQGNGENVLATAFDAEEVVKAKYEDACEILEECRDCDVTVRFGVDATKLQQTLKLPPRAAYGGGVRPPFRRIVFNFPHVGKGIKDEHFNIVENQKLMAGFFRNALPLLDEHGEIHVAVKLGKPYDLWNVRSVAHHATDGRLKLKTEFCFDAAWFPGYAHRRTIGFQEGFSKDANEEIEGRSHTMVFGLAGRAKTPGPQRKQPPGKARAKPR